MAFDCIVVIIAMMRPERGSIRQPELFLQNLRAN
jgi:hypothetical protein